MLGVTAEQRTGTAARTMIRVTVKRKGASVRARRSSCSRRDEPRTGARPEANPRPYRKAAAILGRRIWTAYSGLESRRAIGGAGSPEDGVFRTPRMSPSLTRVTAAKDVSGAFVKGSRKPTPASGLQPG